MKRLVVRATLLSAVVVGGFVTITAAQKVLRVAEAKAPVTAGHAASEPSGSYAPQGAYAPSNDSAQPYGEYGAAPTQVPENPFGEPTPADAAPSAYGDEPPAQFMPAADAQPIGIAAPVDAPVEANYPPPDEDPYAAQPPVYEPPSYAEPAQPTDYQQPAAAGGFPAEEAYPPSDNGFEPAAAPPRRPRAAPLDEPTPADPTLADPAVGGPLGPSFGDGDPYAPVTAGTERYPAENAFGEPSPADPAAAAAAFEEPTDLNADAAFAAAAPAPVLNGPEGTGRPGDPSTEGPQSPLVTIHKIAPAEVQVGQPAQFQIVIRNSGSVAVDDVVVHDDVPQGTQLVAADPAPQRDPDGTLVWSLGNLSAGAEATIDLELMPIVEGEIGSQARVSFTTTASMRTVATRPALAVEIAGPQQVMIEQGVPLTIKVTNTGTGDATGVYLTKNLPPGLKHAAGDALEYEIGTLKPGEARELQLTLTAAQAGQITSVVTALGDGQLQAEGRYQFEIIAPALEVALDGPSRRYLDRPAVYTVSISNPGTAPATDVELVAYLPRGLKFVEADNYGEYDPQTGAVHWLLEELPAKEGGEVKLTALPTEAGEHTLRTTVSAQPGLGDEAVQQVLVEGVAAVQFEVVDIEDPIEVGGETTYEIRVINNGSKAATNVRLVALLPPQLKPQSAEGPSRNRIEGQRVLFEGLPQLAPKAETTYRVRVAAQGAGDARVRVQVLTDDMQTPVTKEESTQVFSVE